MPEGIYGCCAECGMFKKLTYWKGWVCENCKEERKKKEDDHE